MGVQGTLYESLVGSKGECHPRRNSQSISSEGTSLLSLYPRLSSVMSVLFQALSEAKDVLIDAEARKWYDELLQQQRKQGGRGGWRQNEAMGVRGNRDGAGNGGGEELAAVPYSGRQLGMLASSSQPVRYGNYVMSRNIAQDNENRNRPRMSLQACLGSGTNMQREKEAYRGSS